MTIEILNGYDAVKKGFLTLLVQIFNRKIKGLAAGLTSGDIHTGILTGSGIPNTNFLHGELSFDGSKSHKLQHVVITENISIDFLDKLLKATNENILIISYGNSKDNSKYDNASYTLSMETIQPSLDELNDESQKYIFLPITLPIQSTKLDELLGIM